MTRDLPGRRRRPWRSGRPACQYEKPKPQRRRWTGRVVCRCPV